MRARSFVASGLLFSWILAPAHAQTSASPLDDAGRSAIVAAAATALRDRYVYPDVGEQAATAIEAALATGRYDEIEDPSAFAVRLTADLEEVAHDKHMRVVSPSQGGGQPPPGFTPPPPSESGVVRADRLVDDIGYIQIVAFAPVDMFKQPVDRTMADLADARALIVDLRVNTGGDPASVKHLLSYFIDSAPIQFSSTVTRTPGTDDFTTQEDWIETTPAVSYAGKPIFVLTSKWTVSAGEAFAFHMQNLDLGTLIGETTAGAANITNSVPLEHGFQIAVPYARGEGATWEGVGVSPDIAAPGDDALRLALEQLGQTPAFGDVDALSQERAFTARETPAPGAEAAVRRMTEELGRGEPDYDRINERMGDVLRERLGELHDMFVALGKVESVSFVEINPIYGDTFEMKLANGSVYWAVALDPEGEVVMWFVRPIPGSGPAAPD
jgi:hypothetical protein